MEVVIASAPHMKDSARLELLSGLQDEARDIMDVLQENTDEGLEKLKRIFRS